MADQARRFEFEMRRDDLLAEPLGKTTASSIRVDNPGADVDLLLAAIEAGCHVFLTRDKAMIRKADFLSSYWLLVTSPVGLLNRLAETGELKMAATNRLLLPDSHKWLHGIAACEASPA